MCGINGFNFKDENLLKKMSAITYSRGPDNEGFFLSDEYSVSHNRLSIIDLTNNWVNFIRYNRIICGDKL